MRMRSLLLALALLARRGRGDYSSSRDRDSDTHHHQHAPKVDIEAASWRAPPEPTDAAVTWGLLIDAGSTGSRLHVFAWSVLLLLSLLVRTATSRTTFSETGAARGRRDARTAMPSRNIAWQCRL